MCFPMAPAHVVVGDTMEDVDNHNILPLESLVFVNSRIRFPFPNSPDSGHFVSCVVDHEYFLCEGADL